MRNEARTATSRSMAAESVPGVRPVDAERLLVALVRGVQVQADLMAPLLQVEENGAVRLQFRRDAVEGPLQPLVIECLQKPAQRALPEVRVVQTS